MRAARLNAAVPPSGRARVDRPWRRVPQLGCEDGELQARYDDGAGIGAYFASHRTWTLLERDRDALELKLVDIAGEARANPGKLIRRVVATTSGADSVPLEAVLHLKDRILSFANDAATDDVTMMARYRVLCGELESVRKAIDEAEGMLDMARVRLIDEARRSVAVSEDGTQFDPDTGEILSAAS